MLTMANLTNYRTCMACDDQFHLDDGDDYILGFVCNGCDEQHRQRFVTVVELATALRAG